MWMRGFVRVKLMVRVDDTGVGALPSAIGLESAIDSASGAKMFGDASLGAAMRCRWFCCCFRVRWCDGCCG